MKNKKILLILIVISLLLPNFADARRVRADIRIPISAKELSNYFLRIEEEIPRVRFDRETIIQNEVVLEALLGKMREYNHGVESIEEIYNILAMIEDIAEERLGEESRYAKVYITNNTTSGGFGCTTVVVKKHDTHDVLWRQTYDLQDSDFNADNTAYVLEINNLVEFFNLFSIDMYQSFMQGLLAHEMAHRILAFDIVISSLIKGFQDGFSEHKHVAGLKFDFTQYPNLPQDRLVIALGELAAQKISSELVPIELIQDNYRLNMAKYTFYGNSPSNSIEASFTIAVGEMLGLEVLSSYLRGIFGNKVDDNLVVDFKYFFERVKLK